MYYRIRPLPYGETYCYKGIPYACVFPEKFWQNASAAVLACVRAHENVHIADPRLYCSNGPCDESILVQLGKPGQKLTGLDVECPAWHETLACLEQLDKKHAGWLQALAATMRMKQVCEAAGKWWPPTWEY